MALTLSGTNGVVGAGFSITPSGAVAGIVTVGAAVTISESGIEASGIGITCANINGTQIGGRRNIVINGAMLVSQRGTSTTSSGYLIDRQNVYFAGLDEALTISQGDVASGTSPYAEGFRKSLLITNGNQTGGADDGDRIQPQNKIESQDIANSGWKYTDPNSFITISFWAKSSVAQTFYGYLRSKDGTEQRYAYSVALSANTWTKVIKTIPGNSNLQFDNDANEGLQWNILLPWIGANLTDSGVSLNTWGTYATGTRTPDNTSTWYTTNDATFELTGLQLEVGSQATPFEHRRYQEEFQLCKRYYQQYPEGIHSDNFICVPSAIMACNNTTTAYYCPTLRPTMRSSPSFFSSGNFRMNGTASVNNVAVTAIGVYHNGAATPFQFATVASGLTAGQAVALSVNNDATAYIAYDAEL